MAIDYVLTDFDVIPWTAADESRPPVELREMPGDLSERGRRVLESNPKFRGIWDETADGFPSDSERAFAFTYHAGRLGCSEGDAAFLLLDFYRRPGKKPLHQSKLALTMRAWVKGREAAAQEAPEVQTIVEPGPDVEPPPMAEAPGRPAHSDAGTQDATVGVESFLAPPPELHWDIESIRIQGDHGWTSAAPKSMKGFFSLEEARACATGTPFLGHFATRKRRVLYISEEDRLARLHRRVHALLAGRPPEEIPGPEDLRFLVKAGVRLDTLEGLGILRRYLEMWRPHLVFLEHFDKLHAKRPNQAEDMKPLLDELDVLHAELGCTFRVQKHNRKEALGQSKRKGEMLSGSITLFGWGESSVYITLVRRGVAQVEVEAKDGDTAPRFLVAFTDGKLTYAGEVKADRQEEKREAVLEFLERSPRATTLEVAKGLKVTERTARSRLRDLERDELVLGKSESSRHPKHWWLKDAETRDEMGGKQAVFPTMELSRAEGGK